MRKEGGHRPFHELVQSKTNIQGVDIDKPIRNLIYALNNTEYTTIGSCAGHGGREGFVTFQNPELSEYEREDIKSILQSYGLQVTNFEHTPHYTAVNFHGVG